MQPNDAISQHFRLVPQQRSALARLGIATIAQLVRHVPARYDHGGEATSIAGLIPGNEVTLFGTLEKLDTRRSWKRRVPIGEGVLRDATGSIKIMWFHQPYIAKKFIDGTYVKAVGTVGGKDGNVYLANPHVERASMSDADTGIFSNIHADAAATSSLFAVYPESQGITSLWFRHAMERVFASGVIAQLHDPIPDDIRTRYNLPDIATALHWIHIPEKESLAQAARKRFAFEEMFVIQVARAHERAQNDALVTFPIRDADTLAERFLETVPFPPTGAQKRAIASIFADFTKPNPMARLLEGDVGAGKTLVAAATAYATVMSRPPGRTAGSLQVAYMAPTEILAQQHFESFINYFKDAPINIALITGSGCKKFPSKSRRGEATTISRTQLLKWVANGEIAMVVGTHALIQKSIQFRHLAYAIVDEQHRFGTAQRRALAKKSTITPHFLSMTATPIPRTLALTMYGDLDIAILDELPPGRQSVRTEIMNEKNRHACYEAMRTELKAGRQAYVICPRIDEPDPTKINALQAKSAKAEAKRLGTDIFPEYDIGLLHGGMKPAEKDAEMRRFERGETHILVATSVVEVGVNVPNATVILIEGAERFGLAQLHQLRGRVQRSSHQPYCYLIPGTESTVSLKRLRTLARSSDGFVLAEEDLKARGAGDLYGRSQWGISDLGMEALQNPKLIQAAREEAQKLVQGDPTLVKHEELAERVLRVSSLLHGE